MVHALRARAGRRVLLGHLLSFGFIYPEKRDLVPKALLDTLLVLRNEATHRPRGRSLHPACRGTLLSRKQYRVDVEVWGFRDARLDLDVRMTERNIAEWTRATVGEGGIAAADLDLSKYTPSWDRAA